MDFQEKSYSALIVSAAKKFNTSLLELFPDYKYFPIRIVSSVSAAKRALLEQHFDFIIVSSPLPDDDGIGFSIDSCIGKSTVVLLMVKSELYNAVFDKISPYGVFMLPKPTAKQAVLQALDWMETTRERLRKMEKKTMSLEDKMQEIRTINHAKWLLIDRHHMTEDAAHKYIEKQAMNRCVSRKEIADAIIKTYS